MVYRLRQHGVKLNPDEVLHTGKLGVLEFWRPRDEPDRLNARLRDAAGNVALDNLDNVVLVRSHLENGLLLRGTVLSVKSGEVTEMKQSWWCLVHSVEPLTRPP